MADEGWLTVPEVARQLRVAEGTVREWLRTNRLKGIRMGGTRLGWRVRPSEVERFVREAEGRAG